MINQIEIDKHLYLGQVICRDFAKAVKFALAVSYEVINGQISSQWV